MSFAEKATHEIKTVGVTFLFFGTWFCVMVLLKGLVLAEYRIEFHGLSLALVGALIVAKVVLVMDSVPLGASARHWPGWVHVAVRTALYALGVVIVLLLEKAFEARHEPDGVVPSLIRMIRHQDIHHIWATTIGVTGPLLVFNAVSVVRRCLGTRALLRMFIAPLPAQPHDHV